MIVIVQVEDETVYMDKVDFINQYNQSVDITTIDSKRTTFPSIETPVKITVFADNGVRLEPTT